MAEEESFSDKVVELYRECSRVPAATRAHLSPTAADGKQLEVEVTWAQNELERGKKISYNKSYFVEKAEEGPVRKLCVSSCQADATNVVKVAPGNCGRVKRVLLVKDKTSDAEPSQEPQQFIEVWTEAGHEKTLSVADIKEHGKINEDIHFGCFHMSPDDRYLLYIAEKKKPKAASFFSKTTPPAKDDPAPVKGVEHDYEESWGEQLATVVNPVPVVMDLTTEKVVVLDTASVGDISAGQAVWVPGEKGGVVFVGWENEPRKLGFVYCFNRNSALFYGDVETGKCSRLMESSHIVYYPRFNPQGSRLIYFRAPAGGPHRTCAALMVMEWSSRNVSTVVDIVARPKTPSDFPGFYNMSFPRRCWDNTGTRLLCHNTWGSLVEVTHVDITTGTVSNVSGGDKKGAWLVLDVACDLVVAQFASLNKCPQLYIGAFPRQGEAIVWTELSCSVSTIVDQLTWEILSFPPLGNDPSDLTYQCLLLQPQRPPGATPPPMIVFPHGGPHTVATADFSAWSVCLAVLGHAVLMVNYRGSMGYGQDSINSLPGKVGTQDVQDVQRAAKQMVDEGVVDGGRVFVMGGSHGGFLSAHLVGQYPTFYKAAVIRNPVINIGAMWSESDIPDWCSVEGGLTFDPATPPNDEQVGMLQGMSPISHVHKVEAAVLLNIGALDLRCPPTQGLLFYHALKAQGKNVRLLWFPKDNHPISKVPSDADAFVNSATWFHHHQN